MGNKAGLPQSAAGLPLMSIRTLRSSSALAFDEVTFKAAQRSSSIAAATPRQ
ncbi:hypothetical protein [Bradyrhizobium sp. Leo121]|uniref:hypothetical protein n=1 Tax=Bradyrhizobium sp. Leo121 TaxID=1571195 RepID=UPI0013EF3A1F|nr:hypothetical protein [Bradyrhizobium sp. Leo121]